LTPVGVQCGRRWAAALLIVGLLTACSTPAATPSDLPSSAAAAASPDPTEAPSASATASAAPESTPEPVGGVYGGTVSGELDPRVADVPERVYVPNEEGNDVAVIDPSTFQVIDRFAVGDMPEHVNPDWGLEYLWVSNMNGGFLTKVDPMTSQPIEEIDLPIFPYALYYTLDGEKVMVVTNYIALEDVADNGVHFYDPDTWEPLAYVNVPWPGADDADLTADGRYLAISAEYSGYLVFIDTEQMTLAGQVEIGSLPRDVRLGPAGDVFYVTNEGLDGIQIVDAESWELLEFIPTGDGAHGLEVSRDATRMFVANRAAGTISVIDVATRDVIETWAVGGSPDEMVLNPDGTQLWASNRYHGSVSVIDTTSGAVITTIATGANPHGLTYWPQPGSMAIGQNGNMR
jgi:YVTN family beta-propeller protein